MFVELVRIIETLFDGVDEMQIMIKILNDEKAYAILAQLLQQEKELENAA
ncbi:MAG: hypothetical protein KGY70_14565 [Bacteroidales bacterium]|nr:hypothetical protein [Bacteroidales bacterium]MBS3776415.1 hypothetical protein [Bacteroidales bacterium]